MDLPWVSSFKIITEKVSNSKTNDAEINEILILQGKSHTVFENGRE